jgi:hypothetical protein
LPVFHSREVKKRIRAMEQEALDVGEDARHDGR